MDIDIVELKKREIQGLLISSRWSVMNRNEGLKGLRIVEEEVVVIFYSVLIDGERVDEKEM